MRLINLTKNQKKELFVRFRIMVMAFCLATGIQNLAFGNREGNGGAGIKRGGRTMTFYRAGKIGVKYNSETGMSDGLRTVDGLNELVQFVDQLKMLSPTQKGELLGAIYPTEKRKYYEVDEDWLNSDQAARILSEYRQLKGIGEDLELFALTDTFTGTTFILPAFHRLESITEKAAIMFHEAYWIVKPSSKYEEVYNLEVAFQAYIEDPTNESKLLNFVIQYGVGPIQMMKFAYQQDMQNGFINDGQLKYGSDSLAISFNNVVGPDWMSCVGDSLSGSSSDSKCSVFLIDNAKKILGRFRNSLFAKVFLQSALAHRINAYMLSMNSEHCDREEVLNLPLQFNGDRFEMESTSTYFNYHLGQPIWWLTDRLTCRVQISEK
jgi:hypothetical protein